MRSVNGTLVPSAARNSISMNAYDAATLTTLTVCSEAVTPTRGISSDPLEPMIRACPVPSYTTWITFETHDGRSVIRGKNESASSAAY